MFQAGYWITGYFLAGYWPYWGASSPVSVTLDLLSGIGTIQEISLSIGVGTPYTGPLSSAGTGANPYSGPSSNTGSDTNPYSSPSSDTGDDDNPYS